MEEKVKTIRQDILIECSDDFEGFWAIIKRLRLEIDKEMSKQQARKVAMEVVRPLLQEGLIEAGPIKGDWKKAWDLDPHEVIKKIDVIWDEFGDEPKMWNICWFRATKKGEQEAERLLQERQKKQ